MKSIKPFSIIISLSVLFQLSFAQNTNKIREVSLSIINKSQFCSLSTINTDGYPENRMMQTLPVGQDFIIWLGTNPKTQKVAQIKNNPMVSVYYAEDSSGSYVNVQGKAEIITDIDIKNTYWKEGWEAFYPDKEKDFVLIKITPVQLQMVSYDNGLISEKDDWRAFELKF